MRTGRTRIYVVYFFTSATASVFLLPSLGLQELAFRRGMYCHGTDLAHYYDSVLL